MRKHWREPNRYSATVLWMAWALLLAGGLAGRFAGDTGISSIETELKAGSSLALVAFAWLSVTSCSPRMQLVAWLVAVGMTLGCLGDASPLLGSIWPDPQRTLGNMLLFGVGHVCYIRAFVLLRRSESGTHQAAFWHATLALWLVVGAISWYFAAYMGTQHQLMRFPALAYTLLLSATAGTAVGYVGVNRSFAPVAVGTILFLISDLLLAVWIFHGLVYRSFDLVWLNYGLGQMLIVCGTSRFTD